MWMNKKFVYQVGNNKKVILWCTANQISRYKKSVINMGTKVYNNLPKLKKKIYDYKAFKKKLKLFLLLQTFYSVEEFVSF